MPRTDAALNPEWSLLLAACSETSSSEKRDRVHSLSRELIRWRFLVDLADRHGTQPLLYQALVEADATVPTEEMKSLKRRCETNLHKALLLSRELILIVDRLSALGIEALPYKGVALAEIVYGDVALRQSGDIDLFIRPHDLSRVRDAVRDLGYKPHLCFSQSEERAYLKSGYEYVFDGTAGRNLLEVQWAIQPRFYAVDYEMDGVFQRGVNVSVAGHSMKTPSSEDLLLALTVHASKHVWGRLIWLCDIARIMNLPDLDWPWIAAQAEELGILRILRVTMLLANRLLGTVVPGTLPANSPEDPAALTIVKEIEPRIVRGLAYDTESLPYFRLMMRLRERPSDRLLFLRRLLFTPGPSEWAVVRLPRPLFPLYRLVRLSRLAARLVRL